jgi:hypothetical protein
MASCAKFRCNLGGKWRVTMRQPIRCRQAVCPPACTPQSARKQRRQADRPSLPELSAVSACLDRIQRRAPSDSRAVSLDSIRPCNGGQQGGDRCQAFAQRAQGRPRQVQEGGGAARAHPQAPGGCRHRGQIQQGSSQQSPPKRADE